MFEGSTFIEALQASGNINGIAVHSLQVQVTL